jgi:hypothetical protein
LTEGTSFAPMEGMMKSTPPSPFVSMTREELLRALEMFAKNWLAHDGCWFLAAEEEFGLDTAIKLDGLSWKRFAAVEAKRIMGTFKIPYGGGLQALEQALALRLHCLVNTQRTEWTDGRTRLRCIMEHCKVQQTRREKGLASFPCKAVGIIEFETFASTIDSRIRTTCLHCPPDAAEGNFCGWEFSLSQ